MAVMTQVDIDDALRCVGLVYGRGGMTPQESMRARLAIANTAAALGFHASAAVFWQATEMGYAQRSEWPGLVPVPDAHPRPVLTATVVEWPYAETATAMVPVMDADALAIVDRWQAEVREAFRQLNR